MGHEGTSQHGNWNICLSYGNLCALFLLSREECTPFFTKCTGLSLIKKNEWSVVTLMPQVKWVSRYQLYWPCVCWTSVLVSTIMAVENDVTVQVDHEVRPERHGAVPPTVSQTLGRLWWLKQHGPYVWLDFFLFCFVCLFRLFVFVFFCKNFGISGPMFSHLTVGRAPPLLVAHLACTSPPPGH